MNGAELVDNFKNSFICGLIKRKEKKRFPLWISSYNPTKSSASPSISKTGYHRWQVRTLDPIQAVACLGFVQYRLRFVESFSAIWVPLILVGSLTQHDLNLSKSPFKLMSLIQWQLQQGSFGSIWALNGLAIFKNYFLVILFHGEDYFSNIVLGLLRPDYIWFCPKLQNILYQKPTIF